MDERSLRAQAGSCARKRRFLSRAEAKAVVKSGKYPGVKPYLCQFCGVYHLGHRHGNDWEF